MMTTRTTKKIGENALDRMVRLLTELNQRLCVIEGQYISVTIQPNGSGILVFNVDSEYIHDPLYNFMSVEKLVAYLEAPELQRTLLSANG